ncbi:HAMP domain-containing protein [Spirulina subsalsa FACHB-351]|uniref:histidine kinase n=2 Tax=Spirulina subsalsa TaxID=54311 RepID=A0ABT3L9J2_9CYAN|nr:HAMP domain-containing protein [Spirulina subsalsa FACHB-351]
MVSLMGYLAFVQAREALKASVFAQLNIAASLKERELSRWLSDQGQDLLAFSHLPSVEQNATILLTTPSRDPRYIVAQQALQENLERFVEYQDGLQEVFLISRGGRVLGSSDRQIIGQFQPLSQYSEITRDENTPLLSNFYRSASTGKPQMTLATPSKNAQGQTLGLFATHLNLERMDHIIRQQISLGATGETYLVSDIGSSLSAKNVLISAQGEGNLDDLEAIDSYGIQQALSGQRGQGLYTNHRQQPVIGVYLALPGKGLGLLVEQSQWEAFAPARSLAILLLGLGIMLSSVMAGGMVLLGRQIIRPIRAIAQTARRVSTGDLNCQTPILTDNELGQLAQGFNHMIHQLQQSYQALSDYNHTLESKVFERTQALQLKNQELESTLEELTRTQTHLIQNEKMAGLGQLVAGVAHEINNPVNFIHGNLSHLDQYSQDLLGFVEQYQQIYPHPHPDLEDYIENIDLEFLQDDLPKVLASMRIGTERIREIVLSLRTFSRLDESEQKAVDIHAGLDSTLLILHNRFKGKGESPPVQLVKHYGNLPLVDCYPGQLNQVFVNLISNALDALEEQVNHPPESPPQITITTALVEQERVRIEIADNGPGMSEEVQGKLFDPFFTTKPIGKGTGLGMSISYSIIVERHQGTITCHSRLGEGTMFRLQIPLRQARG